jgi:hypothetical protein
VSFLNFHEQLLPVCEIITEAIEDIFGFKVPEGLKLEPFADVVSEVLHFDFDKGKRSLEGVIEKMGQL